ncbi:hypothetical protein ACJ41O_001564 [Fusarium nematophilum]
MHAKAFLIWWPLKPERETIYILIDKVPEMSEQTATACIKCGCDEIFFGMKPKPTSALYQAAKQSINPFYAECLDKWILELQLAEKYVKNEDYWEVESFLMENKEPTGTGAFPPLHEGMSRASRDQDDSPAGPYNSESVEAGDAQRHDWVTEETLRKMEEFFDGHAHDIAEVEGMREEELETWKNEHCF